MSIFSRMLDNLTTLGFFDFMLPWLLFLAMFFGILQGKKLISEDTAVNGVIAIVASFFVAYIARGVFFTKMFGLFGVVAAGFLVLLVGLGMFGLNPTELFGGNKTILSILMLLVILLVFISAGGLEVFSIGIDSDAVWTVLLLLIMVGAVAFIGGGK